MRAALPLVLLSLAPRAAQARVTCQGVELASYRRFTSFVTARPAGTVAVLDGDRLARLQPQSVCRVSRSTDVLTFTVSTTSASPSPGFEYLGVEIVRVFTDDPTYSLVSVGRNSGWWRGSRILPRLASRVVARNLDEFVAAHRSPSSSPPVGGLAEWHASADRLAPSSWADRELITDGVGSRWRELLAARRLLNGRQLFAQGSYLLLRFQEATEPSVRKRLSFKVLHKGATIMLLRLFSPEPSYNQLLIVEFGKP
jgi:hypothetical protein